MSKEGETLSESLSSFPLHQKVILESAGFHDFILPSIKEKNLIIYRFESE